jgi:hypothetical protein
MTAPERDAFTAREWKLIERLRTPSQVQRYLNSLPYNAEPGGATLRSFRGVVAEGSAHCLEAAISAAVILEQHGYPTTFLDLSSADDLDHVLFLYRKNGRFGTVARSRDPGLHGRKPVFRTVRALVDSYFNPFVDKSGRIVEYGVGDLQDLGPYPWRLSERNVWKVERYFIDLPHLPFHGSDRRYRTWHERYLAYKKRYPDRKPLYYPAKKTWAAGYPKGR